MPRGRWSIRAMCSPVCGFPATTRSISTRLSHPITTASTRT
ncbi:3-polyprenyl-4-hydroxybenzoate carboxy-lyase UbiX [Caballeronia sordidicola]|uniref:3-polyprenyl-4-hydroxybenzoate carboxy-lyase UbiX n=1 Tax=Caballeronia sordidicola TaxID=196367 RepID=A0A226WNM1_CABSO|nr:3-polyprenyl-4-hydroxybenzoate carboxy-lyase UbiX [Caballeronia sordidicola]